MYVRVEPGQCIGVGNCVELAPRVFTLDDDGIVELRVAEVSEDAADVDAVVAAEQGCPTQSITLGRTT